MSYLAIARKWRPQRFGDVVGQPHVTRTLQNATRLDRVHHAFLFTGARGVGKTSCARILAKALNCENLKDAEPCGVCQSCLEIARGSSPDVIEIDGASNNRVDEIRTLRESARYLPTRGRKKIYIIDEVHMLTESAFNALLKTLEEPPEHIVFVMATTEPQKIPDTIQSRTLRFDFKRMGPRDIIDHLGKIAQAESFEISESALSLIAREAEGSMRDSQSLLDQVMAFAEGGVSDKQVVDILGLVDRQLLFELLEGVLRSKPSQCLSAIEKVFSFGYDLKQLSRDLLEGLRHVSVIKAADNAGRFMDLSEAEMESFRSLASGTSPDVLSRMFSILLGEFDAIKSSESPRYHLEMTLLRMSQVRPVQSLDGLISRLAGLESRLLRGAGNGAIQGQQPPSREPEPNRSDSAPPQFRQREQSGNRPAPQAREKKTEKRPKRSLNESWNNPSAGQGKGNAEKAAASDASPHITLDIEPPPAGGSPGQPGPGKTYRDFLLQMDRNNPRFHTLIHGVSLDEQPGSLRLGFPIASPIKLHAARRFAAEQGLLSLLAQFFGGPMTVEIASIEPDSREASNSMFEEIEAEKRARVTTMKAKLLGDKTVRFAMTLFELSEKELRYKIELGQADADN